jgi:NADP-dependent 3-hydroxy acid dehydrogenase YdfG
LRDPASLDAATNEISTATPAVDILINCGGAYLRGPWEDTDPDKFNDLLTTNVIGPFELTRLLLPRLEAARGDIVFVNSSITRSRGNKASHYKATQHALQSLSDSLRVEVNDIGIRVLSIYPGRTATPLQEFIYADEHRDYLPDALLQPSEIADSVLFCLSLPETAEVTDLYIRPRKKS